MECSRDECRVSVTCERRGKGRAIGVCFCAVSRGKMRDSILDDSEDCSKNLLLPGCRIVAWSYIEGWIALLRFVVWLPNRIHRPEVTQRVMLP